MPIFDPIFRFPPAITVWNRLEGRPRTADFDRALKAEVRDALWMLSRQWQLGEFTGDDAGSPVFAKVHMQTTALTKYDAGGPAPLPMPTEVPLEVQVEHQPVPFTQAGRPASLDVRLLMGRHWLKLLAGAILPGTTPVAVRQAYIAGYGVARPDPSLPADALLTAHPGVWQQFAAVAGRAMDGYKLYEYLKGDPARRAYDGIAILGDPAAQAAINTLAERFVAWFEGLYYQPTPTGNPSWKPPYLEHQFSCSAPVGTGEKVLTADEYYHGHLDWYNLDVNPDQAALGTPANPVPDPQGATTLTFIPSNVTFAGMPHTRWWEFEHGRTNFGDIKPDTTDLNKLMLLDFGLLYANDWFLLPFTLPVGSLASVAGLSVTNAFGERFWIGAAGAGADEDWQRWNLYSLSVRGNLNVPADTSLLLAPAAPKVQEAPPLEQVFLVRDEVANMVWGVEARVPLATGAGLPGKEAAHQLRARYQQFVAPVSAPPLLTNQAAIRYQVVNSVPEYWIPFVPVQQAGSNRQIQLQRAAMPRILEGDSAPPRKVEPRTSLLRHGLDAVAPQPYFLHEEEVPRSGVRVSKSFQRTRWYNGRVYTWLGIRKQTGRGEGFSGLAFDQILPKEQ